MFRFFVNVTGTKDVKLVIIILIELSEEAWYLVIFDQLDKRLSGQNDFKLVHMCLICSRFITIILILKQRMIHV